MVELLDPHMATTVNKQRIIFESQKQTQAIISKNVIPPVPAKRGAQKVTHPPAQKGEKAVTRIKPLISASGKGSVISNISADHVKTVSEETPASSIPESMAGKINNNTTISEDITSGISAASQSNSESIYGKISGNEHPGSDSINSSPVIPPRPISTPDPPYPEDAREKTEEGVVTLQILVTKEGGVGSAKIVSSSHIPDIDNAALDGVKLWRFTPALQNSKPVESWVQIKIIFQLKGGW